MSIVVMLLGAAILIGWTMISGLRFHLWLQRYAPALAVVPFSTERLVFGGLMVGIILAVRLFEAWPW